MSRSKRLSDAGKAAASDFLNQASESLTAAIGASETEGANRRIAIGLHPDYYRSGSALDQIDVTARAIVVDARKRGKEAAVEHRLRHIVGRAHSDGIEYARKEADNISRKGFEATRDKIVCSAIATLEFQMAASGGLPPSVVMSSYTICRMIDALNEAGYTAKGRVSK